MARETTCIVIIVHHAKQTLIKEQYSIGTPKQVGTKKGGGFILHHGHILRILQSFQTEIKELHVSPVTRAEAGKPDLACTAAWHTVAVPQPSHRATNTSCMEVGLAD